MKNKSYGIYCISVLLLVIAASVYPIIMGARILADWLPDGIVAAADYPKYVIPYTPLSLALIAGTALLPLFLRYLKKWATPAASALSLGIFFAAEHFLEGLTVEADISGLIMVPNVTENVDLGNWQMYMCAITPPRVSYEIGIEPIDFSKTQVGILAGEYSPAFKLHFYLISTVLIIAITGCIYGFGQMLKSGEPAVQHSFFRHRRQRFFSDFAFSLASLHFSEPATSASAQRRHGSCAYSLYFSA